MPSQVEDRTGQELEVIPDSIKQIWDNHRTELEAIDRDRRHKGTPLAPPAVAFYKNRLILRTGTRDYTLQKAKAKSKNAFSNLLNFGKPVDVAFNAAGTFTASSFGSTTTHVVKGIVCAEQAIMISKLIVMSGLGAVRDTEVGRALTRQLSTGGAYKTLSQMINPFEPTRWKKAAPAVALSAVKLKIDRDPTLMPNIIKTISQQGGRVGQEEYLFVEAAGKDIVWGSGDTFDTNGKLLPPKKIGSNYLGLAYTLLYKQHLAHRSNP